MWKPSQLLLRAFSAIRGRAQPEDDPYRLGLPVRGGASWRA